MRNLVTGGAGFIGTHLIEKLLNNKAFKDQNEIDNHVKIIEDEIKVSKLDARMRELENWLKFIDLKVNM